MPTEAEQMAELHRMLEAKRASMPAYVPQTATPRPKQYTPEQIAAFEERQRKAAENEQRRQEWLRQQEPIWAEHRKQVAWRQYIDARGCRYADCRIENFVAELPAQRKAITKIRAFAAQLNEHIDAGHNLLLLGSVGTGKDHLLTGLIWLAIHAGRTVEWKDGADLYAEWRDAITAKVSEDSLLAPLINTDVLAISEPIPGRGAITEFQAERLSGIIDQRYARQRPTWITANAADRKLLAEMTSGRLVDRLADHDATIVFFNWPSWRQRGKNEKNVATG